MHLENFKHMYNLLENIFLENLGFYQNILIGGYWLQVDTRNKSSGSLGLMPPKESIERPNRVNSLGEPLFEIL